MAERLDRLSVWIDGDESVWSTWGMKRLVTAVAIGMVGGLSIFGWADVKSVRGQLAQSLGQSHFVAQTSLAAADIAADLQQFDRQVGTGTVAVSVVTLNPRQANVYLRPFWASPLQVPGLLDTQSAATRDGAAIAINGGFFSRITHQPLGALRSGGQWVSSPILGRGVMAWNDAGEFLFSRVTFQERVRLASVGELQILDLNSGFFRAGFARYTPVWGRTYLTATDNEVVVTVAGDRITDIQLAGLAESLSVPIPSTGYLLVARQVRAAELAQQMEFW